MNRVMPGLKRLHKKVNIPKPFLNFLEPLFEEATEREEATHKKVYIQNPSLNFLKPNKHEAVA